MGHSDNGTGPQIRPSDWAASAVWAAFVWFYIVALSQFVEGSFYVAVRGTGIVQYPSAMAVFSGPIDRVLFVGLGIAALVVNSVLLRVKGGSDLLALLGSGALAAGIVGYAFFDARFVLLIGAALVAVLIEGSARVAARSGARRAAPLAATFIFILAILAILAAESAARWVIGGFDGSTPLGDPSWNVAILAAQALGLVYPVLPELTLLFFFAWAVRLALASELRSKEWPNDRPDESVSVGNEPGRWSGGAVPVVLLLLGIALAAFVGIYAYLKAVNPTSMLVGVDVRYCYSYWLQGVPGSHVCGPAGFFIGNERYGALWFLQALVDLTGSVNSGLMLAPAVLGGLLTLATYALVKEGSGDGFLAGIAALFTGVSMGAVAGVDAGILANWLGLSFAFSFFATVLRGIRTRQTLYVLPALGLFAALLFIHPWTWAVALGVLAIFLGLDLLQAGFTRQISSRRFGFVLIMVLIGLGLGVDLLRSRLPSGSGLIVAVQTVLPSLSPANIPQVVSNLEQTLVQYLGGAQANPLWFVLGFVGVLAIPTLKGRFGKLLAVWVGAISVGVLIVAPPSNLLQSRMIYDVPVQIFAALGVVRIIDFVRDELGTTGRQGDRMADLAALLLIVAVVGLALGFALDYVGFLYQ